MNYFRVVFVFVLMMFAPICAAYTTEYPWVVYNNIKIGFGAGGERIGTLIRSQNENLFTRVSVSKEFLKFEEFKLGLEAAVKSGFFGSLDISDDIQDAIGGPTPIILSGPRLQILATMRKYACDSRVFALSKLGIEFNTIKFDRCDFDNLTAMSIVGYVGIGLVLNERSEINIAIGSSSPMTTLKFPQPIPAFQHNPYTKVDVLINFGYML